MGAVGMILRTFAEIAVGLSIVYGFIKESRVIRFEEKSFRILRALRKKASKARDQELKNEIRRAGFAAEYETERRSKSSRPVKPTETKKRKTTRNNRVA